MWVSTREEGPSLATLINVPLFHVTGCNSQLLVMLELGGRAFILTNPLDLDGFLRTASEERIQMLTSVPAIYHALTAPPKVRRDRPQPRALGVLRRRADRGRSRAQDQAGLPACARVGNGFGLTETSSLTSYLPHEEAVDHADSVGFAMPVVDIALHEPDPQTGVGELLVRGENVVRATGASPTRRRRRSWTAGCTRATSLASTTMACSTSSTGPRT